MMVHPSDSLAWKALDEFDQDFTSDAINDCLVGDHNDITILEKKETRAHEEKSDMTSFRENEIYSS